MIEEIRIDCLHQSAEELEKAKELRQDIFRLNHTLPDTEEYRKLLHKVFPNLGENCRVETPFSGVRTANVRFGRNVIIMPGCLMMSAGGITIDDDVADCRERPAHIEQSRPGEAPCDYLQTCTYLPEGVDRSRCHYPSGSHSRRECGGWCRKCRNA